MRNCYGEHFIPCMRRFALLMLRASGSNYYQVTVYLSYHARRVRIRRQGGGTTKQRLQVTRNNNASGMESRYVAKRCGLWNRHRI